MPHGFSEENRTAIKAKDNQEILTDFLQENETFILGILGNTCHVPVDRQSDIFSCGIDAFCEAVNKYYPDRGDFRAFAARVIRSRAVDFLRKEYRRRETENRNVLPENLAAAGNSEIENTGKDELIVFRDGLAGFGITFEKLSGEVPSRQNLRKDYLEIGRWLAGNPEMSGFIESRKQLPVKEIACRFGIHRKKIERGRNYILAVYLVWKNDLTIIREYLVPPGGC